MHIVIVQKNRQEDLSASFQVSFLTLKLFLITKLTGHVCMSFCVIFINFVYKSLQSSTAGERHSLQLIFKDN